MMLRRVLGVRVALGAGGLILLLSGCELLPHQSTTEPEPQGSTPAVCPAAQPTLEPDACLLHDWVAYGLDSQRGDREWRRQALAALGSAELDTEGTSEAERELVRAVALAWGTERQWREASELYQAHTQAAPEALQPLLRYWRNELEGRRSLASQNSNARAQMASLQSENAELADKLEALTAIEQNMNLRQQSP